MDATVLSAVTSIIKTEGLRGLYRGWGALAMRDLPFDAIEFPFYEFLKSSFRRHMNRELYAWENSFCGCLAGGVTAAVTTPLDVIKTRIMTSPDLYGNMADCLVKILTKEGPQVRCSAIASSADDLLHLSLDMILIALFAFS